MSVIKRQTAQIIYIPRDNLNGRVNSWMIIIPVSWSRRNHCLDVRAHTIQLFLVLHYYNIISRSYIFGENVWLIDRDFDYFLTFARNDGTAEKPQIRIKWCKALVQSAKYGFTRSCNIVHTSCNIVAAVNVFVAYTAVSRGKLKYSWDA